MQPASALQPVHSYPSDGVERSEAGRGVSPIEVRGDWNITRNRMLQKWAVLTDADLYYSTGRFEELLSRIQTRTGETRTTIERFLSDSARRQA